MRNWDELTQELNRLQAITMNIAANVRRKGLDAANTEALVKASEGTGQLRKILEDEVWQYVDRQRNKDNVTEILKGELTRR